MFCKEKGPVVVNSLSELNTGVIFIKLIQVQFIFIGCCFVNLLDLDRYSVFLFLIDCCRKSDDGTGNGDEPQHRLQPDV